MEHQEQLEKETEEAINAINKKTCKPRMEKDSFQLQAFHPLCLPCVTT